MNNFWLFTAIIVATLIIVTFVVARRKNKAKAEAEAKRAKAKAAAETKKKKEEEQLRKNRLLNKLTREKIKSAGGYPCGLQGEITKTTDFRSDQDHKIPDLPKPCPYRESKWTWTPGVRGSHKKKQLPTPCVYYSCGGIDPGHGSVTSGFTPEWKCPFWAQTQESLLGGK